MLRVTVSLALLFALTACSGEPTGPEPVEPPTAPASVETVEITGTDEGTDSLTLQALGDTVRIDVAAYDADGNELGLEDRDVSWRSSDTTAMQVNERGAFLIPDQVWFNTSGDRVIFLNGAPESEEPKSATLTVTVDGVEAGRTFVQTSPTWAVNVSPDGSCTQAPGTYEDPYDDFVVTIDNPKTLTATLEARDYWGRIEPLDADDIDWTSSDPAVATVEGDPAEAQGAVISIHDAGFVDIGGTVGGITDIYGIESSDSVTWNPEGTHATKGHGSVACSTGPGG